LKPQTRFYLKVKSGAVLESRLSVSEDSEIASMEAEKVHCYLAGKPIYNIQDWKETLRRSDAFQNPDEASMLGSWLNDMFGK